MIPWRPRHLLLLSVVGVLLVAGGMQAARDSCPQPQPWNGTGPPPPGAICEAVYTPGVDALFIAGYALLLACPLLAGATALRWKRTGRRPQSPPPQEPAE